MILRINFFGKPDGKLVPPKEITVGQNQLEGFNWREKEKPTKEEVLGMKIVLKKEEPKNQKEPQK